MNTCDSNFSGLISVENRVLIVTTGRNVPAVNPSANGMTIVTDLTGAGYPFDVMTYDRFIHLKFDSSNRYDVIFLNGHTTPVPVESVSSKCAAALRAGRKIFINGIWPYTQYDTTGQKEESLWFCETLFDMNIVLSWCFGKASVPKDFEKDPIITRRGQFPKQMPTFHFRKPPEIQICIGRHLIGFLTSKGGAIDGDSDYTLNLLDYAKVVGYLRHGVPEIVGFANDRIQGRPIVSIEVHCDATRDIELVDQLEQVANKFQIPFSNLLVLSRATPACAQRWRIAGRNPLMLIGSHSRTHPMHWKKVEDFYGETIGAIAEQRQIIPQTGYYFNFSGGMNPTRQQIETFFPSDTVFGAQGGLQRVMRLPFARTWKDYNGRPVQRFIWRVLNRLFPPVEIQRMPTCKHWFEVLSTSSTAPFCLSQTLISDFATYKSKKRYDVLNQRAFLKNLKYGMYSYGFIHDYAFDNIYKKLHINGISLSDQILTAFSFFKARDAIFIPTELLIRRLRDFICGWISYQMLSPTQLQVTVYREQALANQVKIESRHQLNPVVSGPCVLEQKMIGNMLYVDLKPEVKSTFNVHFGTKTKNGFNPIDQVLSQSGEKGVNAEIRGGF